MKSQFDKMNEISTQFMASTTILLEEDILTQLLKIQVSSSSSSFIF